MVLEANGPQYAGSNEEPSRPLHANVSNTARLA
jgi:hypothetical protein